MLDGSGAILSRSFFMEPRPEFEGSSVFNQKVKRLENTLNIAKLKKNPIFSRSDMNKIAIT